MKSDKAKKLLTHKVKLQAKRIAIKTMEDKDESIQKLPQTISDSLPNIPIVTPFIRPKLKNIVSKVTTTLSEQTRKKLAKGETDTDVLIIGAGISGITMATKLQRSRPFDRFMILERREDIGGTWDLFQYPGIRSDSDMTTFCLAKHPWYGNQTLASGDLIKSYLSDTVDTTGIKKYIHYGQSVEQINWSSTDRMWIIKVHNIKKNMTEIITCRFVIGATGYYDYKQGYQPYFEGQNDYQGKIIHPQEWRKDFKYHNKRIVIIGSGATAITLLPALLDDSNGQKARHVTMLQRSPTYIASISSEDNTVEYLSEKWDLLSKEDAYEVKRWKNIIFQQASYRLAQKSPEIMKKVLKYGIKKEIKNSNISAEHFTPEYNPWDERLCAVPDGDLFKQLKSDQADIITDHIEKFTKNGIQLKSGQHIEADIIVTATGLNLQMLGGAKLLIDNNEITLGQKMTYKAVMVEDIPNLAVMFGYTNASWTLKIDLATFYVIRLLNFMYKNGYEVATPISINDENEQVKLTDNTIMGALSSGYVERAVNILPKQGDRYPWFVTNNYLKDRIMLLHRRIGDEWLNFK